MKRKTVLLFVVLSLLLLTTPIQTLVEAATPPSAGPALEGCWTLTKAGYYNNADKVGNYQQILPIPPDAQSCNIEFKKDGNGQYLNCPGSAQGALWHAEVFKGIDATTGAVIYYVPMSFYGQSAKPTNFSATAEAYLAVFAGIADSATHITGTWVDMRGGMSAQDLEGSVGSTASKHPVLYPISTGRYTLEKKCSK